MSVNTWANGAPGANRIRCACGPKSASAARAARRSGTTPGRPTARPVPVHLARDGVHVRRKRMERLMHA
jgi:hypothetical protein